MCKKIPDIICKTVFVLALVVMMLYLAACNEQEARQYTVNSAVVISTLGELDQQFEATEKQVKTLTVFSEDEQQTLIQVQDELNQLRQTVHNLVKIKGGLTQVLIDAGQLRLLYQNGAQSYLLARTIIQTHWNELPLNDQIRLKQYDQQAITLNQAITTFLEHPGTHDITPVIRDILTIGAAAAKILIMTGAL